MNEERDEDGHPWSTGARRLRSVLPGYARPSHAQCSRTRRASVGMVEDDQGVRQ